MGFNLALNTVAYIMVFIFPGLLFRSFFYIKHDTRQFDKGNLFERFMLTIFTSVIILLLSYSLYFFIHYILGFNILDSISYETFRKMFEGLEANTLPTKELITKNFQDYFILLLAIYFLSLFFGYIFHKITNTKFIKSLGLFHKMNYWHDLIVKDFRSPNRNSGHKLLYTLADVLVIINGETKLYSGTIVEYYIKPTFNELQTLVLKDVYRHKKGEQKSEKKIIPGHLFIIHNKNIVNINLTYIYDYKPNSNLIKGIVKFLYLLGIIALLLSTFTVGMHQYIPTIFHKILFVVIGLIILTSVFSLITEYKKEFLEKLIITIMFSLIMLGILGIISWWKSILLFLSLPVFIGFLSFFGKKDNNKNI